VGGPSEPGRFKKAADACCLCHKNFSANGIVMKQHGTTVERSEICGWCLEREGRLAEVWNSGQGRCLWYAQSNAVRRAER
jgi:hypothetical protein